MAANIKQILFILCTFLTVVLYSCEEDALSNPDEIPIVILKADDLGEIDEAWARFMNIIQEEDICAGIGIITNNVKSPNTVNELQRIASKKQLNGFPVIEFWNHGYNHYSNGNIKEFSGTSPDYQTEHIKLAQQFFIDTFKLPCHTFSAPYNRTCKETQKALAGFPEIKVWMCHEKLEETTGANWKNPKKNEIKQDDKQVVLYLDYLFLKGFNYKKINQNYKKDKSKPYILIQIHPANWKEDDFDSFQEFIRVYKNDKQAVFMTPYQYYEFLHGHENAENHLFLTFWNYLRESAMKLFEL